MAETREDGSERDEEPERRKAAGGVSLAEEGSDELPALLAFAVGIAVIFVILVGSTVDFGSTGSSAETAVVEETTTTAEIDAETDAEPEVDDEPEDAAPLGIADGDVEALGGQFPDLGFAADGGVLTVTGEIADEGQRAEILAAASAVVGVTEVVDQLTVAAGEGSAVDVGASQGSIVLTGTVPDQAIADELLTRAQAIYADDQIDNQLVVDDAAGPPVVITVSGSMTDEVLYNQVLTGFDGIVGIEPVDASGFELAESNELESSLNGLEPIQFESGSALILPASEPILDQAAEFLNANPDVSIEIGGHTDTVGEPDSNQRLSESRALAVRDALVARDVANELVPKGFGEDRPVHEIDDTEEKRQENRRIDFRIL